MPSYFCHAIGSCLAASFGKSFIAYQPQSVVNTCTYPAAVGSFLVQNMKFYFQFRKTVM